MLGGVVVVLRAEPIDRLGKLGFDLIAILLFAYSAARLRRRTVLPESPSGASCETVRSADDSDSAVPSTPGAPNA